MSLAWQMLRAFAHSDVEVGSRAVSHRDLTSLDNRAALAEFAAFVQ